MIAQGLPAGVSPAEIYAFLAIVLAALGAWKLILGIQVDRKKMAEPASSGHRTIDQPLITKAEIEFVPMPVFHKQLEDVKSDLEKRLKHNEDIFRDRFHKLDEELNSIGINAKNMGEKAHEEFKNLEGRMGEMKASLQHITAQNSNTNQKLDRTIEHLPEAIAKAIERTHRK